MTRLALWLKAHVVHVADMKAAVVVPAIMWVSLHCVAGGYGVGPQNARHDGRSSGEQTPASRSAPNPIPARSRQLILGISADWQSPRARLARYERSVGGPWRRVGRAWEAHVGRNGLAWGRGLHGAGRPVGRGPTKREGDKRSPAGVFSVRRAYGYRPPRDANTRLRYQPVTASWRCVDDAQSNFYNRVVDAAQVQVDWASSEQMRRTDGMYEFVLVVDHNSTRVPGAGSCVFLHVSQQSGPSDLSGPSDPSGNGTTGCTAMPRARMVNLFGWLNPEARPLYVLLPRNEYDALRAAWGLP